MVLKEYIYKVIYDEENGEVFGRIRIKFERKKAIILWSTTQLEGFVLGKWMPLIRYDFAPKEKQIVHIQKEYISTLHKEPFACHPQLLLKRARKEILKLSYYQIKELIKKREEVFKKEGK